MFLLDDLNAKIDVQQHESIYVYLHLQITTLELNV